MTRHGVPTPRETRRHHFVKMACRSPSLAARCPAQHMRWNRTSTASSWHAQEGAGHEPPFPLGFHNHGFTSCAELHHTPLPVTLHSTLTRAGRSEPQEPTPFSPFISKASLSYGTCVVQVVRPKSGGATFDMYVSAAQSVNLQSAFL